MTRTLRTLLPGIVVTLAAVASLVALEETTLELVTGRYALVLYVAGSLPAAVFHRSRVVLALGVLATLEMSVGVGPEGRSTLPVFGTFVLVTLAGLSLLRDRGLLSRVGLLQLGVVGALSWAWLAYLAPPALEALERFDLLPAVSLSGVGISETTLVVGLLSLLVAAYGVFRWRGPVERALLWSLVLLLLAHHPDLGVAQGSLLMMAGGLLLSLSVVETTYMMAYRDELTGLPARRALIRDLAQIGGTYTIAMVDVDHFKKFNDKHGHDVGDQVLQLVASHLGAAPGGGKAYRYGGEEFTLLYPGRVRADALEHLEAVRESIEDATFSLRSWTRPRKKPTAQKAAKKKPKKKKRRGRQLSVTVSIGMADSTGKGATPESVLKKADKALYRAKEGGRNQVSK